MTSGRFKRGTGVCVERDGNTYDIGRIVGGIAWSGKAPGFAVIIGEELIPDYTSNTYHLHLLKEVEEYDTTELFRRCADLARYYNLEEFFGHRDKKNIDFIWHWNDNIRSPGMPMLYIGCAWSTSDDSIRNHIEILKDCLRSGRKTLHGLSESKSVLQLHDMSMDYSAATNTDFPAIAALGYAVSTLRQFPPVDYEDDYNDNSPAGGVGRDPVTGY